MRPSPFLRRIASRAAAATGALAVGLLFSSSALADERGDAAAQRPKESVPFPKTALQVAMGPTGGASTWRGDPSAGGAFRLGLLVLGAFAPDVITRLSYSNVDDRMLTYLSLGVTGYVPLRVVRPYARLAFAHQHEESRAALEDHMGQSLLGVGHGVRHRGGFAGALGLEAPVGRQGRSHFTLGGDVTATHFPDPRGPSTYVGGTLWASLHHSL